MASQKPFNEWTPEEVEVLRDLAAKRLRPSLIAERLGRSPLAVKGKARFCKIELVGERSKAGVSLRPLFRDTPIGGA